jgi:quercetin dioxygenase-like cupin family protein
MGFHRLDAMPKEVVTPRHSTAYGELLTGHGVELGRLRFKQGEGAERHRHPQEQIVYVVGGRLRVDVDGEAAELGPGDAFHALPGVPHQLTALQDSEVISCKTLVDGAGHRI